MYSASHDEITSLINAFSNISKADWRKTTRWGVKASELRVLLLIKERTDQGEPKTTVSELSKMLQVTSPTVTQIVNGLIKSGYIQRSAHPQDRRSSEITLTDTGVGLAEKAMKDIRATFGGLVDHLGKEQSEQLVRLLNRSYAYLRRGNTDQ
ncbi:MarR family transcriptional regulator [Paenibacillus sp.]|uniref:MarR family winged helix-turn-helix transcriptional regulator n=1 Tax=Paenibacillus sp. TaxID=58172 RepID=UPI002810CE0E|nr:MarR family transcriptional regulator [Paenibacillus sp.]